MKNNFFEDDDFKKKKESFDIFLKSVYSTKSKDWSKAQEKNLLSIFRNTIRVVPAYKEFCKKKSVDYTKITSVKSISCIPSVSKKNYLRAVLWQTLCKDGSLAKESLVMTSTSGSTGEPFYFPRTPVIDVQSSVYHQMFLANCGITKNRSTLVIDCFGMGVWIGGLITYQAFKYIGERGYPITVITPGINKREVFQALRNIGDKFDSIILCGYPPFIKDIIDDGKENNITWSKYSLKIIFAAESFSETFRDYIVKEELIYKIYNLLSESSFKSRLAMVTYIDSLGKKKPDLRPAFFIEDETILAKRLLAKPYQKVRLRQDQLDTLTMATISVFEFMIGNTDWSVPYQHNIKVFYKENAMPIPVPYDFDHSGLVNTSYANPAEELNLSSVKERLFRGIYFSPEILNKVFENFKNQKENIYKLYIGNTKLEPSYIKYATGYLDDFYEIIANERKVKNQIVEQGIKNTHGGVVIKGLNN